MDFNFLKCLFFSRQYLFSQIIQQDIFTCRTHFLYSKKLLKANEKGKYKVWCKDFGRDCERGNVLKKHEGSFTAEIVSTIEYRKFILQVRYERDEGL